MDIRADFANFLVDQTTKLSDNCARWATPVCIALLQLSSEMRFAANFVPFRDWDLKILDDALNALHYTSMIFLALCLKSCKSTAMQIGREQTPIPVA